MLEPEGAEHAEVLDDHVAPGEGAHGDAAGLDHLGRLSRALEGFGRGWWLFIRQSWGVGSCVV